MIFLQYQYNSVQINLQISNVVQIAYKSSTTGKHEVACYMFLEKEDERNIKDAVRGWKLLMPYKETDVGGTIYIGIVSA